ncbi:hypothetical protein A0J61_11600 [Choanephora cucurbitarum]|uniref:Uncharacterized protein n=1 Tax=Choanephora cucurbitarum TaxID=101091 RepID=A0A1C7MU30_9FUNG|nr:hypothetical protein A0J61_11600 [Choanephora cucurbitarum]
MNTKLAIPSTTDEEACDKFVRGLTLKSMRARIWQYEADTLKDAVRAALSFDSAQQEEDFVRTTSMVKPKVKDDPMDLDALDSRRGRFGNGGNSGYNQGNFGSRRSGNSSVNVVEDQEVQPQETDNNIPENKNLIDLDPYSSTCSLDNNSFPVLSPIVCPKDMPTELLPIVYPSQETDELKYLSELNSIATSLPLYSGSFIDKAIRILIDSGASENYVSPHVMEHVEQDQ